MSDIKEVLYSEEEIRDKVKELGKELTLLKNKENDIIDQMSELTNFISVGNKYNKGKVGMRTPDACIELIKVPAHECPCLPPIGCDMLRSKYKLPKPLSGLSGSLIQTVTTIDRGKKLNEVSMNAVKSLTGNKYTSKSERSSQRRHGLE